ncbi:MAG: hypothetical protein K0Q77_55 [Anaerosporomusa subterranea]|jgi:hypothetical protein|nr:hypothetical protein [Anaerosporomusa subterranea]
MNESVRSESPLIAMIVSTSFHRCYEFVCINKLKPASFKIACSVDKLRGISKKTPIIFLYSPFRHTEQYFELMYFVVERFKRVRFIEY